MSTGTARYTPDYEAPGTTPAALSERCCEGVARVVDQNPTGAVLTAFAAGLGIGVAIGLSVAFATPRPKPRGRAEEIGHRVLESIQDLIPESIARRMG